MDGRRVACGHEFVRAADRIKNRELDGGELVPDAEVLKESVELAQDIGRVGSMQA
jgi:hypothetical protein